MLNQQISQYRDVLYGWSRDTLVTASKAQVNVCRRFGQLQFGVCFPILNKVVETNYQLSIMRYETALLLTRKR